MRIEKIRTLNGDNLYSKASVLVMSLDMGELAGRETHEVTGFMDQLLTLLPGIKHHHCANGHLGGVGEATPTRSGFGHITARAALALAALAGIPVDHARVLPTTASEPCQIVVEFTHEAGMRLLLQTAVELVDAIARGETPPLDARLAEARALVRRTASGKRIKTGAAARWL